MVTGFFVSCRKDEANKEVESILKSEQNTSVEDGRNVTIRYTDSSFLKATIVAPRLRHYPDAEDPYTEMPEGVRATFFDGYGRETSRISAASAISYETEKMIVLRDSVRVYNTKGEELQSEELFWDQRKKTIYTNTFVKIMREGETLRGHGFESNETFTKYKILKPSGPVKLKNP